MNRTEDLGATVSLLIVAAILACAVGLAIADRSRSNGEEPYNRAASLYCYTGGLEMYIGRTAELTKTANGYRFVDSLTGHPTEITGGDCLVRFDKLIPAQEEARN